MLDSKRSLNTLLDGTSFPSIEICNSLALVMVIQPFTDSKIPRVTEVLLRSAFETTQLEQRDLQG